MSGFFASLEARMGRAQDDLTQNLTYRVRRFAIDSGMERSLAKRLFVKSAPRHDLYGPPGLRVVMSQSADGAYEKMRAQEYGFGQEPNPVLHRLRNRLPKMVGQATAEVLSGNRDHPRGIG